MTLVPDHGGQPAEEAEEGAQAARLLGHPARLCAPASRCAALQAAGAAGGGGAAGGHGAAGAEHGHVLHAVGQFHPDDRFAALGFQGRRDAAARAGCGADEPHHGRGRNFRRGSEQWRNLGGDEQRQRAELLHDRRFRRGPQQRSHRPGHPRHRRRHGSRLLRADQHHGHLHAHRLGHFGEHHRPGGRTAARHRRGCGRNRPQRGRRGGGRRRAGEFRARAERHRGQGKGHRQKSDRRPGAAVRGNENRRQDRRSLRRRWTAGRCPSI